MQAGTELAERYLLEELLGSGGMGEVWRGTDRLLERPVAVKVMRGRLADPQLVRRLQREARIAARLQHPGLTVVHDVGTHDDDLPFIVMELLHGRDLASMLERAPARQLPVDMAISLATQVAEALQAAHAGRVIHRDLKPANLFLQDNGLLKICDFGIARAADASDSFTSAGHVIGTVCYMSPEQCEGMEVDERSDLYSLGCVLYELLTGQPPFPTGGARAIMNQHLNTLPTGPRARRPYVPVELDALVLNLLAKAPAARPPSAGHVAAALRTVRQASMAAADQTTASPRSTAPVPSPTLTARPGAAAPGGMMTGQSPDPASRSRAEHYQSSAVADHNTAAVDLPHRRAPRSPGSGRRSQQPHLRSQSGAQYADASPTASALRTVTTDEENARRVAEKPIRLRSSRAGPRYGTVPPREQPPTATGWLASRASRRSAARITWVIIVASVAGVILVSVGLLAPGTFNAAGPQPVRTITAVANGDYIVGAITFSPNGKILATAGGNGTTYLWKVSSGQKIATLAEGPAESTNAVAFSPDGKFLATANGNGITYLWKAATGRKIATFTDPAGLDIAAVAFSPDGKILATASGNGSVYLWNVDTAKMIGTLTDAPGHGLAQALAFSPDGKMLAVGDATGSTYLWNVATPHKIAVLADSPVGNVDAVAFSRDGKTLATGDQEGNAYLWDLATLRKTATLASPATAIYALAFAPDGNMLATAESNGSMYLWDVASRRQIATYTDPDGAPRGVSAVAFSPDGNTLATGDTSGRAYLWRVAR